MFSFKFPVVFLLFFFSIISKAIFSSIQLEDIIKLGERSLHGYLALESGFLKNIRFNGNYGSETEYLCHYSLNPEQRTRDCPQDYTTALLQNIFPSPGGAELGPTNATSDFFNRLKISQIKEILDAYADIKKDINNTEKLDKFLRLNSNSRRSVLANWKSKFNSYEELSKSYKKIFLGAAIEEEFYSKTVEYALAALAIKKAHSPEELRILETSDTILEDENADNYDEHTYNSIHQFFVRKSANKAKLFRGLVEKEPRLIAFYLATLKRTNNNFPPILGENEEAAIGDNIKFTACGETSLRNFLNLVSADILEKTFKVDYLIGANQELKSYFDKQRTYGDLKRNDLKNDWALLVSNRKNVKYERSVHEMSPGVDNMLNLIAALFNDKKLEVIEKITPEERLIKIKYLLSKFSRDDFKITTNNVSVKNIDTVTIFINDDKKITWNFLSSHFSFKGDDKDAVYAALGRFAIFNSLLRSTLDDDFKRLIGEFFNPHKIVVGQLSDIRNFSPGSLRAQPHGQTLTGNSIRNSNTSIIEEIFRLFPYLLRIKSPDTLLNKVRNNDSLRLLLKMKNVDVNFANTQGQTPLLVAYAYTERTKILMSTENINVNAQDVDGNTALHLVVTNANISVEHVKLILSNNNVNVNVQNSDGNTALHLAAASRGDNVEIARLLLEKSSEGVALRNKQSKTAADVAIEHGNFQVGSEIAGFLLMSNQSP